MAGFGTPLNTWTHFGLVYKGKSDGEGISVYQNGNWKRDDFNSKFMITGHPSGILKIGKLHESGFSPSYSSAEVDELMFWNRQLTDQEIATIADMIV